MKKKNKLIKLYTIISALAFILCGVSIGMINNNYKESKAVSYDDVGETITLNLYEVQNYVFENLYEQVSTSGAWRNQVQYSTDGGANYFKIDTQEEYGYRTNTEGSYYSGPSPQFICICNEEYNNKFKVKVPDYYFDNEIQQMNTTLTIKTLGNPVSYTYLKQEIQKDIDANQYYMGDSITDAISSPLVLIGDLANEFVEGFTNLVWDTESEQLTNFGIYSFVMLGIAITMSVISLSLYILRKNSGV